MTKAFESAVRLLSRREHSAWEIRTKLKQKGFPLGDVEPALEKCQELDLQNEARFVEIYVRSRARQGYGPLKITQELGARGVSKELVSQALVQEEGYWLSVACKLWKKKSQSVNELQKIQRFLFSRGFSSDMVRQATQDLQEKGTDDFFEVI